MNGFDIILGIPLLYAAYRGFREGIIVQLGGIAGLFIGVYFAFRHSSAVGQWLHTDPPIAAAVGFVVILLAVLLVMALLGHLIKGIFKLAGLGPIDAIGGILLGYIWQILLNGVLANLQKPLLALDARYGFIGLVILMCWQQIGYMMIIYVAGLQSVPGDLIEAAKIDGANDREILFKIKIPMVMPSVTICTFLTLTNSFKLFDQNVALTGGEPANMSEMLALNIYNTFYGRSGAQWKGIGQAKAAVFFLIVVVISLAQLHFTRSKEVQQ